MSDDASVYLLSLMMPPSCRFDTMYRLAAF